MTQAGAGKHLYLLRHALTLPADSGQDDSKRVLAPRGIEDSHALAKIMKTKMYVPDFVLCSPAARTRQTIEPLEEKIGATEMSLPPILYSGSAGDLLTAIHNIGPAFERILLVAHNPSIGHLAKIIAGSGGASLIQRLHEGFRPGTLAVFSFAGDDWADLGPEGGTLIDFMDPLDYNAPATPARWT